MSGEMRQVNADLWEVEADVRCVTTNGTVLPNGLNIMGGGCAREAVERYPWLPHFYGRLIQEHGHYVYVLPGRLVMFPVKHIISEDADLDLITRSAMELAMLASIYSWESIAVPRPGCGLGGLEWEDVGPRLESVFDERFIIVDYVRKEEPVGSQDS